MGANLSLTLRGPLFTKKIDDVVKRAIIEEAFSENGSKYTKETIPQRIRRGKKSGNRQGRLVNTITISRSGLTMTAETTLRDKSKPRQQYAYFGRGAGRRKNPDFNPRSSGRSWQKAMVGEGSYGKGAIRSMLPSLMKSITSRIVAELN